MKLGGFSMLHKSLTPLEDIRDAAEFLIEDTASETFNSYQQNRRLRQSVERGFITIGEAMRRLRDLDQSTFDRLTDQVQIIAFHNVLIHEYDVIDDAEVWETIQESLPQLKREVEGLLREAGED
jgi:uncharacterized protein with HEPN domain